ncbi:MAG: hypothetical protein ACE5OZ_24000 [Candidatus Heimdallarchaeota archaeon]
MSSFPGNLEERLAGQSFPFKARIEILQRAKSLEIRFFEPQKGQKLASTMLEIWEGQLVSFEDFFDFLKPNLPEFIVTDLFINPDLRHRGYALFILKSMAAILNVGCFGLFHVNTNFAGFWIHNESILGTEAQDLHPWLEGLPSDWQESDSILHHTLEGETKAYDRTTHGVWLTRQFLLQSLKIDADEMIVSRNGVLVVRRGTTALIASEGWLKSKASFVSSK